MKLFVIGTVIGIFFFYNVPVVDNGWVQQVGYIIRPV